MVQTAPAYSNATAITAIIRAERPQATKTISGMRMSQMSD
jgi:hypothetical protein